LLRFFARTHLAAALAALLLACTAAPGWAAVQITFYSKELGASFPHAFVTVDGTLDRTGERIAEDYGFSAKTISPAILWGKVGGKVISDHEASYVKGSDPHFTLTLTDSEYDAVMAAVERWRSAKQPSYDLDKANCVHFVGELAAAIGMDGAPRKGLMRKPRSFLEAVTQANRDWLAGRGALLHRLAPVPKSGKGA
jgi:hypothetical protein